jgi:hypothetical protein
LIYKLARAMQPLPVPAESSHRTDLRRNAAFCRLRDRPLKDLAAPIPRPPADSIPVHTAFQRQPCG